MRRLPQHISRILPPSSPSLILPLRHSPRGQPQRLTPSRIPIIAHSCVLAFNLYMKFAIFFLSMLEKYPPKSRGDMNTTSHLPLLFYRCYKWARAFTSLRSASQFDVNLSFYYIESRCQISTPLNVNLFLFLVHCGTVLCSYRPCQ